MSDVECPYCDHEQEVCQDDGHACEDGTVYEEECNGCGKTFALVPSIWFDFRACKADCMNGGSHNWIVNERIFAGKNKYRRCKDCHKSEFFLEADQAESVSTT